MRYIFIYVNSLQIINYSISIGYKFEILNFFSLVSILSEIFVILSALVTLTVALGIYFHNSAIFNSFTVILKRYVKSIVKYANVIHSFAYPALGIKCDAYPARLNTTYKFVTWILSNSPPKPQPFVSLSLESTILALFTINKRLFSTANALSQPGRVDPGLVSKFSDTDDTLELIKEAEDILNKKVQDYKDRTDNSPDEIERSSREAFDACASKEEAEALFTEKQKEITGNSAKYAEEVKSDIADIIGAMEESSMTRECYQQMKEKKEQSLIEILQAENELTVRQLDSLHEGYDFSPYGDKGAPNSDMSSVGSYDSDDSEWLRQYAKDKADKDKAENDQGDNDQAGNHKSDSNEGENEGGQAINVSQGEEALPEPPQDSTEAASSRSSTKFNTSILWLKVLKYLVKALSGDDEQGYDDYD